MVEYNQLTGSNVSVIHTGDKEVMGINTAEGSVLIGKEINTIKWKLYKHGSPTGNCYAFIANNSGVTVYTSPAVDVSTLTSSTSGDWVEFNLGGTNIQAAGYKICFLYEGGTSSANARIYYNNSQVFDDQKTYSTTKSDYDSGSFSTGSHHLTMDMAFQIDASESTSSEGSSVNIDDRLQIFQTVVPR